MYMLTNEIIKDNFLDLFCSYDNKSDFKEIMFSKSYKPETFCVAQKKNGEVKLFFNDISYDDWIKGMVCDQLYKLNYTNEEIENILLKTKENIETLLAYEYNGTQLENYIYNQEFIDIIRKVLTFTIHSSTRDVLHTAWEFNRLADEIMPMIIQKLSTLEFNCSEILKLSIASGMSGLDLKGAPAASSNYANYGIAMKSYFGMSSEEASEDYYQKLLSIYSKSQSPVFDWDAFEVKLSEKGRLLWLTDDYIESYFDLYLMQKLLEKYNDLTIEVMPKNGIYGNDMSWQDLMRIMELPVYRDLKVLYEENRFSVNKYGPGMGAANIEKFSIDAIKSIKQSNLVVLKGCRIHEMLQGSLNVHTFSSYIVSRELSETVTGYNSKCCPILFIHLSPGEYAFYGVKSKNIKKILLSDGRRIFSSMSNLKDHILRKDLSDPIEIIQEIRTLIENANAYEGDKRPVYQEANMLAEKLISLTQQTYDKMCETYKEIRKNELHELDKKMWDNLATHIAKYIDEDAAKIKLLDIGTGSGRDIMYASGLGYNVQGVDNSDGFIELLSRLEDEGLIPENSFKKCDMRELCFDNETFDVVRHNASLLHMPLIAKGYMADLAVKECNRVLKKNGLLFIFVKKGNNLEYVDTKEGLGGRVFQFYNHEMLSTLVKRNGFNIIYSSDEVEQRGESIINWISMIAQKDGNCPE